MPTFLIYSTEEEKLISENYSSLVNKAYQVLQSPLKRAIHLLAIRGEKIQEDQKLENPEFLMEIMELNEEVSIGSYQHSRLFVLLTFRWKAQIRQRN